MLAPLKVEKERVWLGCDLLRSVSPEDVSHAPRAVLAPPDAAGRWRWPKGQDAPRTQSWGSAFHCWLCLSSVVRPEECHPSLGSVKQEGFYASLPSSQCLNFSNKKLSVKNGIQEH